jgi:ABC-type glycerol-3-phosphate transport system substrate-binding protein
MAQMHQGLDWPFAGIAFDIRHDVFWFDEWGQKPNDIEAAVEIARRHVRAAPTLIPLYSHRYLPSEPLLAGNPVFSVYQTDIIYYGGDLWEYFSNEFGPQDERWRRFQGLPEEQFAAAIDLLKKQNADIGEYWSDYTKEITAFKNGDSVVGTTWQIIANLAQADKAPVEAVLPSEGATGWSDTWMVATKSKHKTCAYKWLDWIISPKVNAEVAEWFGEAPANSKSCAETVDKTFCDTFHADDEAYFDQVWYWNTPIAQCLDGRTNVTCKDYGDWTTAWQEIKG